MDLEGVKRILEKKEEASETRALVNSMPYKFFEPFILQGIKVDLVEPGRVVCSMTVPTRLPGDLEEENECVGDGNNSNDTTDDDDTLIVGMEFNSWEEAEYSYLEYDKS